MKLQRLQHVINEIFLRNRAPESFTSILSYAQIANNHHMNYGSASDELAEIAVPCVELNFSRSITRRAMQLQNNYRKCGFFIERREKMLVDLKRKIKVVMIADFVVKKKVFFHTPFKVH